MSEFLLQSGRMRRRLLNAALELSVALLCHGASLNERDAQHEIGRAPTKALQPGQYAPELGQ